MTSSRHHAARIRLDYLPTPFRCKLYEPFTDSEQSVVPTGFTDGQPVESATRRPRDRLIEQLAAMIRSPAPSTRSSNASMTSSRRSPALAPSGPPRHPGGIDRSRSKIAPLRQSRRDGLS